MTLALETDRLGMRYGRRWGLADCTLEIPKGVVVGLVGPNGAGKTTLLSLASGQLTPSIGSIAVLGGRPGHDRTQLEKVGFVAQGTPTYGGFSVRDHLRLGAKLNSTWDEALARSRIQSLGLDPNRPAGKLSGGQRAQLALTLGLAKRPEFLILDEPVAALDPVARREFLKSVMEAVADGDLTVMLSSHLVADLERVCDFLILLVESRIVLAGRIDHLLSTHHRLSGPRRDLVRMPANQEVISVSHADRQSTYIVRTDDPIHDPSWTVSQLTLEDLVIAYMVAAARSRSHSDQKGAR